MLDVLLHRYTIVHKLGPLLSVCYVRISISEVCIRIVPSNQALYRIVLSIYNVVLFLLLRRTLIKIQVNPIFFLVVIIVGAGPTRCALIFFT